jgi:type IV fimbrial biogenesis protein FimT
MVIATVAAPSFKAIIRAQRMATQIYDFDAAIHLARSEAVKRGDPVTVCASAAQTACGPNGTQWEQGWIVFVDKNNNQTVDGGEDILRATPALVSGYTLRATSSTTLTSYITINPKGQASATGIFILCEASALNPSRAVIVSTAGRISMAADHNGVAVDASGADITTCIPS